MSKSSNVKRSIKSHLKLDIVSKIVKVDRTLNAQTQHQYIFARHIILNDSVFHGLSIAVYDKCMLLSAFLSSKGHNMHTGLKKSMETARLIIRKDNPLLECVGLCI